MSVEHRNGAAVFKQQRRMLQFMLFCLTRCLCQFGRLAWSPLIVFIARDLSLTKVEQGELLSAYALGHVVTQVLGGVLADRFGGKPVITCTLIVMSGGMLLAPSVASAGGAPGLYWLYLATGFCAGQHPGTNAMFSAWFEREEMGFVSSVADVAAVAGELLASLLAPGVAAWLGWRSAFTSVGCVSCLYTIAWMMLAQSRPRGASAGGGAPRKEPVPATRESAAAFLLCVPVWAVIVQHMCFNGTKYFFSAWMPAFFDQAFHLGPERSASYLSAEKFAGISLSFLWRRLEASILRSSTSSLLFSRRLFAVLGFLLSMAAGLGLAGLARMGGAQASAPLLTGILLCVNAGGLTAHGFGFKPNYLDLTKSYSGVFMGVGNTFATLMTFIVPLGAAYVMQATGDNWSTLFLGVTSLNLAGLAAGTFLVSVESLDAKVAPVKSAKKLE